MASKAFYDYLVDHMSPEGLDITRPTFILTGSRLKSDRVTCRGNCLRCYFKPTERYQFVSECKAINNWSYDELISYYPELLI
jgi:hypothetical protein